MSRRTLIAAFLVLLFILHQDFWLKSDPRLLFGVLPVSLAYHVGWTLLVAFGWFLVAKFAWPAGLDNEPQTEIKPAGSLDGERPPR